MENAWQLMDVTVRNEYVCVKSAIIIFPVIINSRFVFAEQICFFGLMPKYCVTKHSLFKNATGNQGAPVGNYGRGIKLKAFRKPFHVPLFFFFFDYYQSAGTGIVATNLIAMGVSVYFKCVLFKSGKKKRNCAVFMSHPKTPLARKSVIRLAQQQMLYINYVLKSLENNFLNGFKKKGAA